MLSGCPASAGFRGAAVKAERPHMCPPVQAEQQPAPHPMTHPQAVTSTEYQSLQDQTPGCMEVRSGFCSGPGPTGERAKGPMAVQGVGWSCLPRGTELCGDPETSKRQHTRHFSIFLFVLWISFSSTWRVKCDGLCRGDGQAGWGRERSMAGPCGPLWEQGQAEGASGRPLPGSNPLHLPVRTQ